MYYLFNIQKRAPEPIMNEAFDTATYSKTQPLSFKSEGLFTEEAAVELVFWTTNSTTFYYSDNKTRWVEINGIFRFQLEVGQSTSELYFAPTANDTLNGLLGRL